MQFQIDNMACGGCATSVTKAIQSIDPQAKVDIDLNLKRVTVKTRVNQFAVAGVLEDAQSENDRSVVAAVVRWSSG